MSFLLMGSLLYTFLHSGQVRIEREIKLDPKYIDTCMYSCPDTMWKVIDLNFLSYSHF